jgi:hypothetical protein
VPGGGLTSFKIAFEYTLMALYLAAAARLLWHMRRQRSFNASGLFAAACVMAQSEFFFTRYTGVTDIYNLTGHFYKVLAYAFLYRAVFVETVQRPYQAAEILPTITPQLTRCPDNRGTPPTRQTSQTCAEPTPSPRACSPCATSMISFPPITPCA